MFIPKAIRVNKSVLLFTVFTILTIIHKLNQLIDKLKNYSQIFKFMTKRKQDFKSKLKNNLTNE